MVDGEVMVRGYSKELGRMDAASSRLSSDVRSRSIQQYQLSCQAMNLRVSLRLQEYATFQQLCIERSEKKEVKTVSPDINIPIAFLQADQKV